MSVGFFLGVVEVKMRGSWERKSPVHSRLQWGASKLKLVILALTFAGICLAGKPAIDRQPYRISGTGPKISEHSDFNWSQVRKIPNLLLKLKSRRKNS